MVEAGDTDSSTASLQEILGFLPHRYPFLLIDRIEHIDADDHAIGIKNVTANEPFFPGHFPGRPIMPGVLMIEGMAQTIAAICNRHEGARRIVYLVSIDNARFRTPVVPGDRLEYRVVKTKRRRNIWKFRCEALVDGDKVAEADIGAMINDVSAEAPEHE